MSMLAIFEIECCGRELVHGRVKGDSIYPPTKRKCPFGCPDMTYPNNRPRGHVLKFMRYEGEDKILPELMATWRFPDSTGNLKPKYDQMRQTRQAGAGRHRRAG